MVLLVSIGLTSCALPPKDFISSGHGPEDLVAIPASREQGRMILTGTTRSRFPLSSTDGALERLKPGDSPEFERIPETAIGKFVPLGLCYVARREKNGSRTDLVYSVNRAGSPVEIFSVSNGAVRHRGSLSGNPNGNVNGIAAAQDGRVYVSTMNFLFIFGLESPRTVSSGNHVPTGEIEDGAISVFSPDPGSLTEGTWKTVLKGARGANGLMLSPSGDELLFCSYGGKKVYRISLDKKTGAALGAPVPVLENLRFRPDNLSRTEDGNYIVTGQKSYFLAALQLLTRAPVSPGAAIEFEMKGGTATITRDLSSLLKGHRASPSTLLISAGQTFVGQPFYKGVMVGKDSPVAETSESD